MATYVGPVSVPNDPRTWTYERLTAYKLATTFGNAIDYLAAPPVFQGRHSTGLSVATGTTTTIPLDIEDVDSRTDAAVVGVPTGHSLQTNTSRYYAPYSGWYWVTGKVIYNYTAGSSAYGHIAAINMVQNGVAQRVEGEKRPGASGHQPGAIVGELIRLDTTTGDYVELQTYQNTGSAQTLNVTASKLPMLTARWVCALSGFTSAPVLAPASFPVPPAYLTSGLLNGYRDIIRYLAFKPSARMFWNGTTPATQNLASSAWPTGSAIQFDNIWWDNYGGWSATNRTRYTIPEGGRWLIYGQVAMAASATGTRAAGIRVNGGGTTLWGSHDMPCTTVILGHTSSVMREIRLAAGDYIELMGFQSSGGALTLLAASSNASQCKLIAIWTGG